MDTEAIDVLKDAKKDVEKYIDKKYTKKLENIISITTRARLQVLGNSNLLYPMEMIEKEYILKFIISNL